MKSLLILALMLAAMPAQTQRTHYVPTSVKDWEAKSDREQLRCIAAFVADFAASPAAGDYKVTAEQLRAWIADKRPGHDPPEGIVMVMAATELLDRAAKKGAVDLSKIEIGDVVLWAIDMKFVVHFPHS